MSIAEFVKRELEAKQRAYKAGNLGALQDALILCAEHNVTIPQWLAIALFDMGKDAMRGEKHSGTHEGKGRHSKWLQQYKDDMIDFERAEIVMECLEHGIDWDGVYLAAEAILQGGWAEGGPDAIEKSYKRFKKRSKENPYRYHIVRSVRLPKDNFGPRPEVWEYIDRLRGNKPH